MTVLSHISALFISERLDELNTELEAAHQAFLASSKALSESRVKAAAKLAKQVLSPKKTQYFAADYGSKKFLKT